MWATLQQTKHFARGKRTVGPTTGLIGEWKMMTAPQSMIMQMAKHGQGRAVPSWTAPDS
jgi:hypothetical protein